MPFVSGFLHVRERGHASNELPGMEGPTDPGYGIDVGGGHPWVPGHLPPMPPMVWPPLTPSAPIAPAPPGTPPGAIWPPLFGPVDPGYGHGGALPPHMSGGPVQPPGGPSTQPLPPPTGSTQPLPPPSGSTKPVEPKTYWVVVGVPGVGWRYCAVDPSLVVGTPLPPTATPK